MMNEIYSEEFNSKLYGTPSGDMRAWANFTDFWKRLMAHFKYILYEEIKANLCIYCYHTVEFSVSHELIGSFSIGNNMLMNIMKQN